MLSRLFFSLLFFFSCFSSYGFSENVFKSNKMFNSVLAQLPPVYFSDDSYHNVISVSATGDSLCIEDGSVWNTFSNQTDVTTWHMDDVLVITPNYNYFFYTNYKFKIINTITNEYVYTNIHLGPYVDNENAHIIHNIIFYENRIVLNNGSVWEVSSYDMKKVAYNWLVGDGLIIGTNDQNFSSYKYILIDVNMNNFVKARYIGEIR
jgi:hypothetical protein